MKPVFICGCGRSGTTLIGTLLGNHTDCLTIPEFQFKNEIINFYESHDRSTNLSYILNKLKDHRRFKLWQLNIQSNLVLEQEELIQKPEQIINFIVSIYGETIGKKKSKFWIDHTPINCKYAITLLKLFPDAKMIHIVRDGRAVASSVMPLDWGPNTIIKAASWWVEWVGYGLAAESFLKKHQIIRIKYEDLLIEPEITLKRLCSYLEIDYQPSMIEGKGFNVPLYSSKQHHLVGSKPDKTRVNAWEKKLKPRQIEIFENLTGDFLNYFAYSSIYGIKARNITRLEKRKLEYLEMCMKNINKLRNRYRFYLSIR